MSKGIIFLAGALTGAGAAFIATYSYLKKQFDKELEVRVESFKSSRMAQNGPKNGNITEYNEETDEFVTEIYAKGEKIDEIRTKNTIEPPKKENRQMTEYDKISRSKSKYPFPITSEEFLDGDYEKVTYVYFREEDTFIDILNEICPDAIDNIGKDNLDKFGIYEPDVLYVRNNATSTDYEVLLKEDISYKEYVGEE